MQPQADNPVVLEARGIGKRFPGVIANENVSFTLRKGQIHAFLGENGAGKSTLMNILYGLYHQDEGEILVDGRPVRFSGPHAAIAAGIGMVHQHFMLVPPLTVTENIILGKEKMRGGRLDIRSAAKRVAELSEQYGLALDPYAVVGDLPVGLQQRVEIVKAFYRDARILILDEPTAVLRPQEADELTHIMRTLANQGVAIIFITHKLREVLEVLGPDDPITVLRRGRVVYQNTRKGIDQETLQRLGTHAALAEVAGDRQEAMKRYLAEEMVGRAVILQIEKDAAKPAGEVLGFQDLIVEGDNGLSAVNGATLSIRSGEIVGLAGVEGNGQTELTEALTGLRPIASGTVTLAGKNVTNAVPRVLTSGGLAHVPQDRQRLGLVMGYSIEDNMVLSTYYTSEFARGGTLNTAAIEKHAIDLVRKFDVRTPGVSTPVSNLSGGNQQKVVVAREFSRDNKALIAAQPTRGLDVGSIEFIHRNIVDQRDKGVGVLLVSAELDEIMSLSDRIAVIYKGQIVAVVDADKTTREELGLLMAGGAAQVGVA